MHGREHVLAGSMHGIPGIPVGACMVGGEGWGVRAREKCKCVLRILLECFLVLS